MVFHFRCVLSCTNLGMVKLLGFYSKLSKLYLSFSQSFTNFSIVTSLANVVSLINHSNQLLVYCISSICNW